MLITRMRAGSQGQLPPRLNPEQDPHSPGIINYSKLGVRDTDQYRLCRDRRLSVRELEITISQKRGGGCSWPGRRSQTLFARVSR